MRIAFATTLSEKGSTNIGRVFPLAQELEKLGHECHILLLGETNAEKRHYGVGREPFKRDASGKTRLGGFSLIFNQLEIVLRIALSLIKLKPDAVVIVKSLPANTLGVWLWKTTRRFYSLQPTPYSLILDVDDFELMSNELSSLTQRAAIHWAERAGAKMAAAITCATPFLVDHFKQLTAGKTQVELIPTGLNHPVSASAEPPLLRKEGKVLAYIGSVSIKSGHRVDLLPEILKETREKIPEAKLLIAGDGDDVDSLKNNFKELGLEDSVIWHGRFDAGKIDEVLSRVDLLIDPVDSSIANRAKSSYRVALATLCGFPVVTSNVGIRPTLLPEATWTKFFAEQGSAKSYSEKIVKLLSTPLSPDEIRNMKQHSAATTWSTLAKQYANILNK